MGKTKKLYLAKRMLAMILAVAMSVTMVPQTVFAAPAGDTAVEDIVDAAAEKNDADIPADGDVPGDGTEQQDTGDIVSDGTAADGAGDNDGAGDAGDGASDVDGTEGTDDAVIPADKGGDDAATDGDANENNKETNDTGKAETNAEGDTPAAQSSYKITLDGEFATKAVYAGQNQPSPFADIMSYVTLTKVGEDDGAGDTEKAKITTTWKQKGEDGNYTDIAGNAAPKNAGSYQAVLTYPKQDGVHEGANLTVDCEITKAPVTITLENLTYEGEVGKLNVKPGTKKKEITTPTIDVIESGNNELEKADVTLDMEIKNAVTDAALGADDVLTKDGDYCMVLTPSFKEGISAERKDNQELKEFFTVDIEMTDLIDTKVVVTLADKHKQEGEAAATQITKEYDGTAIVPEESKEGAAKDYTVKVQYLDETTGEYKDLTSELAGGEVKTAGEWGTYDDCEVDADGKVIAPVNAGTYTYKVVYAGKDGVYGGNYAEILVEIAKAELKVEPVYSAAELKVPENTAVRDVLAKLDYKVTNKAGTDVTAEVKAKHIWGTSYDTAGQSQIYEPLFTLQESADGTSWPNIDDMDYELSKDSQYRVAFTGRKAVLWYNGRYNKIVNDINSDTDNNYSIINGVDLNYFTTAAEGKELAVKVEPGTKAVIDVSGLLGEKKGAKTIAELTAKQYDGAPIYTSRSQYKNQVKLTGADGTAIRTEQREFTYTWYRYQGTWNSESGRYEVDRIAATIAEKNQTLQDSDWNTGGSMVSPQNAGVYKLVISYEDKIDPDAYHYADDVTVYFAIDPKQVTIEPKEESYEVLEGRSIGEFFHGEKEIEYTVKAVEGELPKESIVPRGQIVKRTVATPAVPDVTYDQEDDYLRDVSFEKKEGVSYVLQGAEVRYFDRESDEYYRDYNYTCYASEVVTNDGTAGRKDTPLNTVEKPITVVPMGTQQVTITVDTTKWVAQEKVYDAKPFTTEELIPSGVVSVKKADGTEATDLKLAYVVPYTDEDGNATDKELKDVVDAGSYDLYVRFDGDKDYAPFGWNDEAAYPANLGLKIGTFKITQKEIALTADLEESYKAGTSVSRVLEDVRSRYQVTGCVPGQEGPFADKDADGYLGAFDHNGPDFYVTEKGSNDPTRDKLKRDKTYEVRYNAEGQSLVGYAGWDTVNDVAIRPYLDYKVSNAPVAEFKAETGNSEIESVYHAGDRWSGTPSRVPIQPIDIRVTNDKTDAMKREVTMTEAIGWSRVMLDEKVKEGNFVAFRFTAPAEYDSMPATAMYENAIKAKGGYVIPNSNTYSRYFTAVFDASEGDKEFKIRWEDGYVETYTLKFTEAVKLANLEDAVAPKALAFNAPDKKMAVGQEQQLDVKITKEQMGDVIYLGYESDDPKTLVVDEHGNVTALKIGQATVKVFPQHLVNGNPEKIEGAKGAELKIQVTKLDAPKKVKAAAHGNYINLDYDSPAYGYRREIYVAEKSDKFKTVENFETVLKGMRENQWKEKGFAIAPVYITTSTERDNRNKYNYVRRLEDLDIKTDYTVYVRNVCAVRTLTDGTGVVTQAAMNESASGVVVNVKTKKAEVEGLALSFYDSQAWVYDGNGNHVVKYSLLKNGTIECWTRGYFPEYDAEKDILSTTDNAWVKLPFAGEDKTKYKDIYEEPKLEYALSGCYDKKTGTWGWGTKNDYATIDKKGNIKITGLPPYQENEDEYGNSYGGYILGVRVRDTDTGKSTISGLPLMLEEADAVKAAKGSVTLSVGQGQYLEDLLTYSLGNTKWTAYPNRSIDLEKVRSAIKSQNQSDFFTVSESGYLRAINGGGTLNLELTDKNVEKKSGTDKATAKVTIKSKELEPVKGLKARDVTHNRFGLTFSYTGGATQFLLEVSDAKKPIYSKVLDLDDGFYNDNGDWCNYFQRLLVTDKDGKYVQVRNAAGEPMYDEDSGEPVWAWVKDTWEISEWTIEELGIKLTKDSQYTVSLTPIYGENKAKPTTTKVKTTKIPAQDWYLGNEYDGEWTWGCDRRGGMGITVSEGNRISDLDEYDNTLHAVSGNTYTLTANVQYNRGRVNDTLVWTVGDAKVATVKAAAGTYCITLTGVKPGKTTLEVRSKLLGNKVIARYDIQVGAVKNAYNNDKYYGENEPD